MNRFTPIAAAALALLGAVPAVAQGGAFFTATPSEAPKKASVITRSTLWKCTDGVCSAKKSADRPQVMCELVVQRVGTLTAFTAGGEAFDADQLAKCNARAS